MSSEELITDKSNDHWLSWNTYDLTVSHANFLQEDNPELSKDEAFALALTSCHLDFEWEYLIEQLDDKLKELNPKNKSWHVEVENFGWRNLSGYKIFESKNAADFLLKILPDTECSFKIYVDDSAKTLSINNYHHDSPTGEWYYISVQKVGLE